MSKVPPFNELAKQLDPMLPAEDYDLIREKYFQDHVKPRVKNPTALPTVWEAFKKKTERQPLLSSVEKMGLQVERSLVRGLDAMTMGKLTTEPHVQKRAAEMEQVAAREGMSNIPPAISEFIGMIPPSVALTELFGPAAGAVTARAFQSARTIGVASRVLKGGLGFATYEAGMDKEGDRLMAGVRGFGLGVGWGVAGEALLGLPAFLKSRGVAKSVEEGAELGKKVIAGEPVPEAVQKATADYVKNQAASSRAEGNPNLFLLESERLKGVHALIEMPDGNTLPYEIQRGKEDQAFNAISRLLERGGTIDTFQWHPEDAGRAQKFVRQLADLRNLKYDDSLFLRTATGKGPELVEELTKQGIPAEVKGNLVSVPTQTINIPKGKSEAGMAKALADIEEVRKRLTAEAGTVLEEAKTGARTELEIQLEGSTRKARGEAPKLSREQAILLAKRLGRDPLKVDLEAMQMMGEEEITRLLETVQKQQMAAQEAARKGVPSSAKKQVEFTPTARKSLYGSLLNMLGFDTETQTLVEIPFTQRPGLIRAVVPKEVLAKIGADDAGALTWTQWQQGLKELGVPERQIKSLQAPNSPLIVFRQGAVERNTVYHEGIHANLINAELNPVKYISKGQRGIATELVAGIKSQPGYTEFKFDSALDESFTYAAQAVRFNDEPLLAQLGRWDRDVDHVLEFVNSTSRNLLKASYGKLDSPGVRNFQRRLEDLIYRTDKAVFASGKRALLNGEELAYLPDSNAWAVLTEGTKYQFKSLNEAWDHIIEHNLSDYTADPSFWAQVRGMRGPLTEGPPPGKRTPLPTFPIFKETGSGLLAISGLFRPFLPWVSTLDYRINQIVGKKGMSMPIYQAVRAVDDGIKAGDKWLISNTEKFGKILQDWTHEKQHDLFELMTFKPEQWGKAAAQLRLSDEQLQSAERMLTAAKEFSADTGINLLTYWREFYPQLKHAGENIWSADTVRGWGMLKKPEQQGFWERAVTSNNLDPSDNHMGKFLKWVLKEGYEKKFTGRGLDALQKLVDLKTPDGAYVLGPVRWPLRNYVNYVRGVPDGSATILNRTVKDIQGKLVEGFKKINPSLPEWARLPEEFNLPSATINRFMLLSYTAGLALRPAVTVRDALQVFVTGMPIIGPKSFARGMARIFSKEGRDFAENSGALLHKHNIGELYGDVFSELPLDHKGKLAKLEKFGQKLLGPSRWGNNLARGVVFNGAYEDAVEAIGRYQAGKLTSDEFLKSTHLWFADGQRAGQFLARAAKEPAGNLGKDIALEIVEATQWPYRRGTQPALLRTGMGRILGQYGNWPLNYLEFVKKLGVSTWKDPSLGAPAVKAMATWIVVNKVASELMESAGADSSSWLWTSPAGYTGGPAIDLINDLSEGIGVTEQAKEARARVLRYPLNFVPAWVEARSIMTALEREEDLSFGGKGFLRAMGFKPLEEVQRDQDYIEWALEESGITANPRRR